MIKIKKIGTEGTYLNIIKVVYDKPTACIIHNGEKLKAPKISNKTRVSTFAIIIPHSPNYSIQRTKSNESNLDRKKRNKALTVCR